MEEGETFQLGNGNHQIVEEKTEETDSGQDDVRI
jgi:hypothetical protein